MVDSGAWGCSLGAYWVYMALLTMALLTMSPLTMAPLTMALLTMAPVQHQEWLAFCLTHAAHPQDA